MKRIALAYSGSLDTTLSIHWLKEHMNYEVLALAVDMGIKTDLVSLGDRALRAGANSAHILDLKEKFCEEFVLPSIRAQLQDVNDDPYATALGRPLICQSLVELAHEHGALAVAHACKPGLDDKVRFENELQALAPNLKVINPMDHWNLQSNEQKLRYARTHNLPLDFTKEESEWSLDGNIWGHVVVINSLDDTWKESPPDSYRICTKPGLTPDEPETVVIEFKSGMPMALNNQKKPLKEIISELNEFGAKHGIGHHDLIYHRLSGKKSRKIIESPAATIILAAHRAIEEITLDPVTSDFQQQASNQYRQLVLEGHWFSHLRSSLDHFFAKCQQHVSGEIKLEVFKGNVRIVGRRSPHSIYDIESDSDPTGRFMRPTGKKKGKR